MTDARITFDDSNYLGKITRVDTGQALVAVERPELMSRLSVTSLLAIAGSVPTEWLVGSVDRVVRESRDTFVLDDDEEEFPEIVQVDQLRVVLLGTYRAVEGVDRHVFKRGTDTFPRIDRPAHLIEGANLQTLMSLLVSSVPERERLDVGVFVASPDARAVLDGNRLFQRHAALLGSTGAGKSWAAAMIIERASALKYPNLIVLDMHGEYGPLVEPGGGLGNAKGFRIAGPADLGKDRGEALYLPYWLLNQEEMLALLLDRSDQNAPNQANRFTMHVSELKQQFLEAKGKEEVLPTFTVDSPIPYEIGDLLTQLEADDDEMIPGARGEKQGPFHGKLSRFIQRLRARVEDRRHGFMFQAPTHAMDYDWLPEQARKLLSTGDEGPGIKVIDFSEVPTDILPVVVGVLVRTLYDIQFWADETSRTPLAFVCDEAHLYLPHREAGAVADRALNIFERVAKEGRKYGVSLVVMSQRPADVSRTVLSQCNNFIVLRLTNDTDQHVVRSLIPDSMAGVTDLIPLLDVGEALLLGDALVLPARVRLSRPTLQPSSATREFWTEWRTRRPTADAIASAVEALRRQTRVGPMSSA